MAATVWTGVSTGIIPAPIDKVWEITSDFGGIFNWAIKGGMKSCEIEGHSRTPGCARFITSVHDGHENVFREVLTDYDPKEYMFKYKLDQPNPAPPFTNGMNATFKLNPVSENETELVWKYECPADPANPGMEQVIFQMISGFYQGSIEQLKTVVSSTSA